MLHLRRFQPPAPSQSSRRQAFQTGDMMVIAARGLKAIAIKRLTEMAALHYLDARR